MGRGPMSEPTDGAAFRRRYRRPKYDFARFSSALPRSRRLRSVTKSKPAREKLSPARERIEADEPARVLFEPLEPRYLLSADISPLVIAMADAGHDLTLHHDIASDALQVINDQTGQVVGEQQASRTSQLQIIGTNENDRLTIDLTAGFALPLGIKFAGGGGQDQLVFTGAVDKVMHQIGNDGSGQISFASGNLASSLSYSGVQQVTDLTTAQNRSIDVTGATNNATLTGGANSNTLLTTAAGEVIGFGAGEKSLKIDAEANLSSQAHLKADQISLHAHALSIGGALDADGNIGGAVDLTGSLIDLLDGALIDAHGLAGGGSVHVGGDLHGAGPLPNAATTLVEHGAVIDVSATQSGQGGQAVVWADSSTYFAGSILARGGSAGGDGGFVEVSGKASLAFMGDVNAGASAGSAGTLLLDPTNVDIVHAASSLNDSLLPTIAAGDGGAINSTISDAALEAVAATTNVSIAATNNITIDDLSGNPLNLPTTAGNSVTFTAGGTFSFQNAADKITTAGGDVSITAATIGTLGSFNVGSGTLTFDATASGITLNSITAGTLNVTAAGNIAEASGSIITVSGVTTLSAPGHIVDLTGAAANTFGMLNITANKVSLNGNNLTYTSLNLTGVTDVAVSANANISLSDTTLTIGALPAINATGITQAELTVTGAASHTIDITGFTHPSTLAGDATFTIGPNFADTTLPLQPTLNDN